ncbi:hypothetical protein GC089_15545 [Cellulomonas sp. JZ18]|uniref:hypothetical protein n=1 Tax=Cellulomonas sp. JZ18 TaxID=2654191 RepID=UPI0012D448B6|nr:hypothetical protein [Cellulomonas sp. JZ18]QGQ20344.1 hypothetical protein GC089_15545 [Cellulomonas sp. JZ18]
MTMPTTDERRQAPDAGAGNHAAPPALPQRTPPLPVRQRNRVPLETLEAAYSGLQQVDERARPAAPVAPPPDVVLPWLQR